MWFIRDNVVESLRRDGAEHLHISRPLIPKQPLTVLIHYLHCLCRFGVLGLTARSGIAMDYVMCLFCLSRVSQPPLTAQPRPRRRRRQRRETNQPRHFWPSQHQGFSSYCILLFLLASCYYTLSFLLLLYSDYDRISSQPSDANQTLAQANSLPWSNDENHGSSRLFTNIAFPG